MCLDWLWKARRRVDNAGMLVLYGMLVVALIGRPTQVGRGSGGPWVWWAVGLVGRASGWPWVEPGWRVPW